MMRKIKIGQVGTRHDHAAGKMACVRKFPDIFEVVGVVENNLELRDKAKENNAYKNLDFLNEDDLLKSGVDAVLVETKEYELIETANRFVEKGINVHVDKPAGISIGAFRNMLKTAKAKDVIVQMAYMYRYNPAVVDCLKRKEIGEMGEVFEVDAVINTMHPKEKRQWLKQFDGGIMYFLGCHMIDLVFRIQGTPKKIVSYKKKTGFDGVDTFDNSLAVLEYEKGISTIRASSTEVGGYGRRQIVVCAKNETYEINPMERPIRAYLSKTETAKVFENTKELLTIKTTEAGKRYDDMMRDFALFVNRKKKNEYSLEYELQLQKIVLACSGYNVDYRKEEIL